MKVIAIIQARSGSTRLPGKVLAHVGGRTMLARVVRRTARAKLVDRVLVATSDQKSDDRIVNQCAELQVDCFRGSEEDVLDRYHQAAAGCGADAVVRVTADCPLVDPAVIDRVVRAYRHHQPDYASNTLVRTWPRGLDTEIIAAAALERAWQNAQEKYERVHVTPYLYHHPEQFRLLPVTSHHRLGHWRWTVDRPDDLDFVRAVYGRMNGDDRFSWHQVRRLVTDCPSLAQVNCHVRHKELVEG